MRQAILRKEALSSKATDLNEHENTFFSRHLSCNSKHNHSYFALAGYWNSMVMQDRL